MCLYLYADLHVILACVFGLLASIPAPSEDHFFKPHTKITHTVKIPTLILGFNDLRQGNYPVAVSLQAAVSCMFIPPSC